MSALLKMEMYEAVAETVVLKKNAGWVPEVVATTPLAVAEETKMGPAKSIALFLVAPFIALAYATAMPFVGLGMLAWFGARALAAKVPAGVKKVGMLVAAPFIGLAFIVTLPLGGAVALGYCAVKAAEKA